MIPFPDNKYQIIYADPPWQYKTGECLGKTSILNGKLNTHYDTMTLAEIKSLDVEKISDEDSLLFLWVVSPMLDDCISLIQCWGFKYSTVAFVWYKHKPLPGHYTMSTCEMCLVGKRGRMPKPRGARNVRQFLSEVRGEHSAKPDEIKYRINQMFPTQNKIELFARKKPQELFELKQVELKQVGNWDTWGDEV